MPNQRVILYDTGFIIPSIIIADKRPIPLQLHSNPDTLTLINSYPKAAKLRLLELSALILTTAETSLGTETLEETLKWGEPSYLAKKGSTLRIDWKSKEPERFAIYFKCTSQLVPTFRTIYPDIFTFEGNRAMVFNLDEALPVMELRHCICLALTYHKVKHLPLLGASMNV